MAAILRNQVARASVPQPQLPVQATRGHHGRRLLPLQVNDAHLEEGGKRCHLIRPKCDKQDCQTGGEVFHLMPAAVPQDPRRQVVNGQSSFKVRHGYERQPGKDKRTRVRGPEFRFLVGLSRKQCIDIKNNIWPTGDIHAKKVKTGFPHSRFTEAHRFHRIRFFFVFVSAHSKRSDHLYGHKQETGG